MGMENGTTAGLIMTTERERGNKKHNLSSSEWSPSHSWQWEVLVVFCVCYFWLVGSTAWLFALLSASGAARSPSCWPWCNRTPWVHHSNIAAILWSPLLVSARSVRKWVEVQRRESGEEGWVGWKVGRSVCRVEVECLSAAGKNLYYMFLEYLKPSRLISPGGSRRQPMTVNDT